MHIYVTVTKDCIVGQSPHEHKSDAIIKLHSCGRVSTEMWSADPELLVQVAKLGPHDQNLLKKVRIIDLPDYTELHLGSLVYAIPCNLTAWDKWVKERYVRLRSPSAGQVDNPS